ncbi:MAG: hypothetical protein FWF77_00370, partial [Defluviitaleaceae bacterium]|nr:hypothetical protein [Defluviitaleaceae bacterium]
MCSLARQARGGHRGHVSVATRSLEAGGSLLAHKKTSRRVTLADSFFREPGNCSRLRGNVPTPTHVP